MPVAIPLPMFLGRALDPDALCAVVGGNEEATEVDPYVAAPEVFAPSEDEGLAFAPQQATDIQTAYQEEVVPTEVQTAYQANSAPAYNLSVDPGNGEYDGLNAPNFEVGATGNQLATGDLANLYRDVETSPGAELNPADDEAALTAEMQALGHRGLEDGDGPAFASGPRLTPEQSELLRELNVAEHMQRHPGMDRAAAETDLARIAEFQRKDAAWSAVDARITSRLAEPGPPEGILNLTPSARAELIRREEYARAQQEDPTLGPRPAVFQNTPGTASGTDRATEPFDISRAPLPVGRGETPLAGLRPGDTALGATAPSRVQDLYRNVNEFLGGDAFVVRSGDGSLNVRSRVPNADGSFNQFRMDQLGVRGPGGVHAHLETVRPEGGTTRLGTEFGPPLYPNASNGHFYTRDSSPTRPARPARR